VGRRRFVRMRSCCVVGIATAPLCEVQNCLLRLWGNVQLRYRQSQPILIDSPGASGFDRNARLCGAWGTGYNVSRLAPHARSAVRRGGGRIGIRSLFDLRRGAHSGGMVHSVSHFPRLDFCDDCPVGTHLVETGTVTAPGLYFLERAGAAGKTFNH